MAVIRNSVILHRGPEVVFDYLSDLRAELEWNPKCQTMQKQTPGPVGVGTKYRAKWTGAPVVELDTVSFERPHSWTMHNDGPIEVTFTCRLEPVPEGTLLHAEFEPIPHGWFRLIFPLFLVMMRHDEEANMGHLRDAVERRAATRE